MVLEALAERELVLVDDAAAPARDVGGARVDEALEPVGAEAEVEHVAGTADVDALCGGQRNGEVVDGRKMEDEADLRTHPLPLVVLEVEARLCDVTREQLDPLGR